MKNQVKILLAVALAGAVFAMGCKKLDPNGTGKMTVRMTDAPAPYDEVNVEIVDVQVCYTDTTGASGGWVSLATNTGVYDLLKLRDSVTAVIAAGTKLPAGKVYQMRLILGDSNWVVKDSVIYPLTVPSGQQTGIKLNVNATINAGSDYDIVLDFDALKSVLVLGNGKYNLKPHIVVKSVTEL